MNNSNKWKARWSRLIHIRKLSTRLMLSTFVIAIAIVVAMSLSLFIPNSKNFEKEIEKELGMQTSLIVEQVDEEMQSKFSKLEAIANVGQSYGMDAEKHQALISAFAKSNPEFETSGYSLDLTGKFSRGSDGQTIDLSNRPFLAAIADGQSYISDPKPAVNDASKLVVSFVIPLIQDGKPYGFYATSYTISRAAKSVIDAKIGDTGYAVLVDNQGIVQVHPNQELVGKHIEELGVPAVYDAFKAIQQGKKDIGYSYTFGGIEKIGHSRATKNGYVIQMAVPKNELTVPIRNMMWTTLLAAVVVTLAAIGITYLITTRLAKPIVYITDVVQQLSKGDFRPRLHVKSKDELGVLASHMNEMLDSLSRTIGQVNSAAISVAASAEQITASTDEVARGSVDQADQARTMADLFEELEQAIKRVAFNANQARDYSNEAVLIAEQGTSKITDSIETMQQVNQQMENLEKDSNQIGDIIQVINEIAEQTNLLALNAAIEAARAGEQGRGFAVVADEVRKLAERSSSATKQIASIIHGMQSNTTECVKAVSDGVLQFAETRQSFDGIVEKVNEMSDKVNAIAESSVVQASKASDVLMTIESVASVSEEAAAAAEETAAASQELSQLAERLNESIEMFKYK
ncbi:methyl-accepting chemotaxis sensory transducer with Cache sensor [Paenibacillus cellulosilyticus]|uniref:Methyl-accepting chemotaxis sensory transducer with Cache sensor n=1 Tax=Paenibacillus cellulosilyticus TaxID=375489 RepID=A0A2V2YYA1_9BACL|nr:methyl-accepting chemotaxis protein [Paenibacillus cellulosilyticus]PWW07110.1 methyl-accepting chemotaxis sensory transducer with Cache sensor [Paenibacillus cellulosilyticus]QKS44676.1 methyl-accepting chemotaxis protein [Paenibacillus cellulosilyticus]